MKAIKYTSIFIILFTYSLLAQEITEKKNTTTKLQTKKSPNSPQAVEGEVSFSDGTNQLLRITDEGNFGALELQDGIPSTTTNKIYSYSGTLYYNGSPLGSGGVSEINDLTDGSYDGESLFLGNGAGANDDAGASDGIKNFNLAVGKNSLNLNTTGRSNAAFGNGSMLNSNTAYFNTAIGNSSMRYNTTGGNNVALGFQSNYYNQTGSNNTIIGHKAGYGSNGTSYSGNVFIGNEAGRNETTGDKLYIENSSSTTPLIWGDFANDSVKINGWGRITKGLAVGEDTKTIDPFSIAVGKNTESHGFTSIAVGEDNLAWGFHSSAFGKGTKAMAFISTAVGRYNVGNALASQTNWVETDVLLEVGNGTDDANRANALTVLKNGNVGIGPSEPTASLEVDAVNGVLFSGATTGSIPVEGSGSRMMWYQGKSAFRAGTAGPNNAWDDVNIGSYSTALNYQTKASGAYSFATGYLTEASGQRSTAMGSNTIASGLHSTAIGSSVEATGDYSTTIGRYVKASGEGTLFIGDNSHTSSIHNAVIDNRFVARFANGYRFFTTSDLTVGAKMNGGDNSWSVISDSTKKENFKQVDGEDFLNKISKMKLTSWNYKTQDPAKFRHYGPMAQDFYAAFGNDGIGTVGNDTTIASADFDGVNLIAIQALEKRTKEQGASFKKLELKIKQLEKQNTELAKLNFEYRTENTKFRNIIKEIKEEIYYLKRNQTKIKTVNK